MTWVQLDDRANENMKLVKVGAEAAWFWASSLMLCNRQDAHDGHIAAEFLGMLFPVKQPKKLAKKLVDEGLWEAVEGCYQIHNYHEFQPSRSDIEARKEKKREAGRKGGKASGESRRQAKAKQGASIIEAEVEANNEAAASESGPQKGSNTKPVPAP